jgi:hypothetical protein
MTSTRLTQLYKEQARRPLTLSESREIRDLEQQTAHAVVTPLPARAPVRYVPSRARNRGSGSPEAVLAAARRSAAATTARARGETLETHGIGVTLEHRESR